MFTATGSYPATLIQFITPTVMIHFNIFPTILLFHPKILYAHQWPCHYLQNVPTFSFPILRLNKCWPPNRCSFDTASSCKTTQNMHTNDKVTDHITLCQAFAPNMPHPVPRVNKNNSSTMCVYLCSSLLDLVACTRPGWAHWVWSHHCKTAKWSSCPTHILDPVLN